MRFQIVLLLALLLTPPLAAQSDASTPTAPTPTDIPGTWEGKILLPTVPLGVVVELTREGDAWSGTIDIPMQNAKGLALEGVAVTTGEDGTRARFTIAQVPGAPTFDGAIDGDAIRGDFTQGGQVFPFELRRAGTGADAEPPPYEVMQVLYPGAGEVLLGGTLTVPRGEGLVPGVLLLSGSGAQNRDSEIFGHKPFAVLADALTRAGIAVLRVDDRGIGESGGRLAEATGEILADDALAGLLQLQKHPRVDPSKVGILGHSEGGMIAPLAATRSIEVAFLVLLAAPGVPTTELMLRQNELLLAKAGLSEERVALQVEILTEMFALLASDAPNEEIGPKIRAQVQRQIDAQETPPPNADAILDAGVASLMTPWMRDFVRRDPRTALRGLRTKIPVLALNGDLDLQVDPEQNLKSIEQILLATGNRDVTASVLPGRNHLLQRAETGQVEEYGTIEQAIDPEVVARIRDWILQRFGGGVTE